ncbi:GTP cyclohydrolase II [Spiroplasma endosymbiont of Aspidapion aeneum]|uniref:GTP cyclohydrolase II n=1 Tax=Spiroplasma endosymbiont of Aspidapion aeneum TaxID=3066276 RepID=UPI00313DFBBE
MKNLKIVEQALKDLRDKKIIMVSDDKGRENECDFICAGEYASPENINFMATHGRGLICVPIEEKIAIDNELYPMSYTNKDKQGTAFTRSIDHISNSTGISAFERSVTILSLGKEKNPKNFLSPGHTFPLLAKKGGLLEREGHTEATVDLMKLSGLKPYGVCCEIMREDGNMLIGNEVTKLSKKLKLTLISTSDIIKYIKLTKDLSYINNVKLPTKYGNFTLHTFVDPIDSKHHEVIYKEKNDKENIIVRIHSKCATGDTFGSLRCDCGPQLEKSMELIEKNGGMIIYLNQEGRGIGFVEKMRAYNLQDQKGMDTVQANIEINRGVDERDYLVAFKILKYFGVDSIRLLTNNPDKIEQLKKYGFSRIERLPLITDFGINNKEYINIKKTKMKHLF